MPARAPATCPAPGCDAPVLPGQDCPTHPRRARRAPDRRPADRFRYDTPEWRRNRANYLRAHSACTDCGQPATVPDHDPVPRRELVARGEAHPDAWQHLRPRCASCHNRRTALTGR